MPRKPTRTTLSAPKHYQNKMSSAYSVGTSKGQTIIQRSKQDAGIVDDDITLKEDPDGGDYLHLMHNFIV